ncbi:MAG: S-layer homology domain-containing protein [Ruminococcaceae bacterium]|nr:S-layer homology domain-containing protein [Oscillospiraceae bacterium]
MRTFKKISALVVTLAMIMSCAFSTVSFAATTFTDLDATNIYATAITDLADKGIINGYANEDGTFSFKPDGEITRAEFAKIIAVASVPSGYSFAASFSSFTDVAANHWAVPYIEHAVRTGVINGMGDGTFAPESPVTYAQAIKMVVCTLGYGNVITPAPAGAHWAQPYIEMATRLNITLNAFGVADANATRGLVAQLVYNMNKTTPLVQTGTGADGQPTYSSGGGSYEESTKNTNKESGQLIAVFETTLSGSSEDLRTDEIMLKVDDDEYEIFTMGKFEAEELEELLGYEVNVTYTEDSSGDKELATISKDKSNKVYVVDSMDISDVTSTSFEYYDDSAKGGIAKLKINSNMSVLKNNGTIDMDDLAEELYIDSGEITFIDIDGNNVMDVAFVKSYETYFVSSVTKSNGVYTVYDKFDSERKLILNEDTQEITVKLLANNSDKLTDTTLTSIAASSVLSVAVSASDSDVIEVIISKKTASGSSSTSEVKSISGDMTKIKFGTTNVYTSSYYLNIADQSTQALSVGDVCTAYLDFTGKLVAVNKTATATNYGYIIKAGTKSSGMDDEEYFVRMYDSSGKLYTDLPVADRGFKLNGKSADGADLVEAVLNSAEIVNDDKDGSKIVNAEKATPVKYEISAGTLKSVYVIDDVTDTSDDDYIESAIHPTYISEGLQELKFKSTSNSFNLGSTKKFSISSTTKVIVVPLNRSEEKYRFTSGTGYFTDGLTYMVDAFDAVGSGSAKLVVVYGTSTTIKASAPTLLVKYVEPLLDDDNNEYYRLHYHKLGSSDETFDNYYTYDSDVFADVESGDVIKVFATGDVVENVQRWFSVDDMEIPEDIDENVTYNYGGREGYTYYDIGGEYFAHFGTVMSIPKGDEPKEFMDVSTTGDEEDSHTYKIKTTTPVIIYTGDDEEPFEFGKALEEINDIDPTPSEASKVFIAHSGTNYPIAIVIYEQ